MLRIQSFVDNFSSADQFFISTIPPHNLDRHRLGLPQLGIIWLASISFRAVLYLYFQAMSLTDFPVGFVEWIFTGLVAHVFRVFYRIQFESLQRHNDGGVVNEVPDRSVAPPQWKVVW